MKKATLTTIVNALTNFGFDNAEVMDELNKELNKGATAKAKANEVYDAIHDIVIGALTDEPATCAEIFESIEGDLPMGVTRAKVQYALSHLWADEIVKVEGKPNGYKRA